MERVPVTLQLSGPSIPDESLVALSRDLANTLERETDVHAELPAGDAVPGAKGDPVTLGAIALSVLTSGTAVALIEVLKAFVSREPNLEFEITRADGSSVKLAARNLEAQRIGDTIAALRAALDDPPP